MEHHTPLAARLYAPDITDDSTNDHFSTPLTKLGTNSLADIDFGLKSTPNRTLREKYKNMTSSINGNSEPRIAANTDFLHLSHGSLQKASLAPLSDNAFKANHAQVEPPVNDRSMRYKALNFSGSINPASEPLLETNAKLQAGFLMRGKPSPNDGAPAPKEPIYYRPPSSTRQFLLKSFLPPKTSTSATANRIPILTNTQARGRGRVTPARYDEELEADEEPAQNPTGEWFSPVFKEALKRQVNKEKEFKRFGYNVLYIILSKLAVAIYEYFSVLFHLKQLPFQGHLYVPQIKQNEEVENSGHGAYSTAAIRAVEYYLFFNIALAIYRLVKPQDKCRDLPLTEKQRQLLGLPEESHYEDEDADLTIRRRHYESEHAGTETQLKVPKYSKLTAHSSYNFSNGEGLISSDVSQTNHEAVAVDRALLTYRTPVDNKLVHSGPLFKPRNNEEDAKTEEKFRRKFNLVFDYGDALG